MEGVLKNLPDSFDGTGEVKGYLFKKLEESECAFIYEKIIGNRTTYEVFKKKINRRFNSVSYPKANDFGNWAWDCPNYERALLKFNELNSSDGSSSSK